MKTNLLAVLSALVLGGAFLTGCQESVLSTDNQNGLDKNSWISDFQDSNSNLDYGHYEKKGFEDKGKGRRGHHCPGRDSLNNGCMGIPDSLVPQIIKDNFTVKYPGITPKWSKRDTTYSARFTTTDSLKTEAIFNLSGILLTIETHVGIDKLPVVISDKIKLEYSSYTIKHLEIVNDVIKGISNYEVVIIGGDRTGYKLVYDSVGNLLEKKN